MGSRLFDHCMNIYKCLGRARSRVNDSVYKIVVIGRFNLQALNFPADNIFISVRLELTVSGEMMFALRCCRSGVEFQPLRLRKKSLARDRSLTCLDRFE